MHSEKKSLCVCGKRVLGHRGIWVWPLYKDLSGFGNKRRLFIFLRVQKLMNIIQTCSSGNKEMSCPFTIVADPWGIVRGGAG